MNIFGFRDHIIHDYATYIKSFIQIRDTRISEYAGQNLNAGILWPEPLIQLNPTFEPGEWIETLVTQRVLHQECVRIFRKDKGAGANGGDGKPLRLHRHQVEAIHAALTGENYVLTTGTGSGKSLAYIVPIVNHVLRRGSGKGIQAIVVYPMNALANSQHGELEKFLCHGYAEGKSPVTFARYTGQETDDERAHITARPPDILLTNYVMLELILTRHDELPLINAAQGLRFLVLDELHTYRGRQGSDVALLVRRVRDRLAAEQLQCVGTSATLAGVGTYDEQRTEVARVATQVFGAEVRPERIIMETLRRTTPDRDMSDAAFIAALTQRVQEPDETPQEYHRFINAPLSIWIESTFGIRDDGHGRLVRQNPQSISGEHGVAARLSQITGVDSQQCALAIQTGLLAGYACTPHPETGFPPFAFRLHQFISRGDTVYATLEPEEQRYLTITGQQFKPGSREHVLLPLVFCRECGQEYYCVRRMRQEGIVRYVPRELRDQQGDHESEPGFIYLSTTNPWPTDSAKEAERLPDDWMEERQGARRVRRERRKDLPELVRLNTEAMENADGIASHYISAPFRFCLHCGVSWGARQRDDFAKLTSLGSEGRSTATTILSLSAIRNLRQSGLQEDARKLLSFTDNRQDASLQAGHFNDFIETTLLRSALYQAVSQAGTAGIEHDELTLRVFEALKLPLHLYAYNPEVKFQALRDTERALREVIGYRLYRDLQRGWRITSPNLEQCGLLEIEYQSLDEASAAAELWSDSHPALTTASTATRMKVAKVLLDYMRRELAISVNYLDTTWQEQIRQQSNQRLIPPWAIDENETMEYAAILFPRSRTAQDQAENVFLSARGGFGQYLRRNTTFPELERQLNLEDTTTIIRDLLKGLVEAGLVNVVLEPQNDADVPGYQLQAAAMRWKMGDGRHAFHDPIRVPSLPETGGRTNPFFVDFYRTMSSELHGLEAREHTAQVEYEQRRKREEMFRAGKLPVLYCSPTMELGVDIAELNVVNLRNIPPTPANYAQRSGRAGRSGQPALVFSYCTTGSPHDQYFFKRPELMVSGQVSPPRLDLANEDLLRAHIYAIWLAETGMPLGKSPKDLLDVTGSQPTLALREAVRDQITATGPQQRARVRAVHVLGMLQDELHEADWYHDGWLEDVLNTVAHQFDSKLERWRDLYRAALHQAQSQDRIIRDASRSPADKKQAERLRAEAEAQLKLLTEVENIAQADFYSYRYFASEGFLPGYNFPRLPISAYIPGRRAKQRDEFLSRPRFLAISEFGPRSIVYHEGSRYIINKVILPVSEDHVYGNVNAGRAKLCDTCGYLHPLTAEAGADLCERCGALLGAPLHALFKMQNVSARRRDKINSDEEERVRLGYELQTAVRFPEHTGRPSVRTATVAVDGETDLQAHLRPGGDTLADQSRLGQTTGEKPVRLCARHGTRLLGQGHDHHDRSG